jgi:hypothetical protein
VEVAGGKVRTFRWVDGGEEFQAVGEVPVPELVRRARSMKAAAPRVLPAGVAEIDPEFRPRSPLGLYLYRGTMSVRKVVVEPRTESD